MTYIVYLQENVIKKTGSVDQTQLDSASESDKKITKSQLQATFFCVLVHMQFKRSCWLAVIGTGSFQSVFFCS